jgi:hypothetical protein
MKNLFNNFKLAHLVERINEMLTDTKQDIALDFSQGKPNFKGSYIWTKTDLLAPFSELAAGKIKEAWENKSGTKAIAAYHNALENLQMLEKHIMESNPLFISKILGSGIPTPEFLEYGPYQPHSVGETGPVKEYGDEFQIFIYKYNPINNTLEVDERCKFYIPKYIVDKVVESPFITLPRFRTSTLNIISQSAFNVATNKDKKFWLKDNWHCVVLKDGVVDKFRKHYQTMYNHRKLTEAILEEIKPMVVNYAGLNLQGKYDYLLNLSKQLLDQDIDSDNSSNYIFEATVNRLIIELETIGSHLSLIDEYLVETKKRNPKLTDHKIYHSAAFDNTVRKHVLDVFNKDKILELIDNYIKDLIPLKETYGLEHSINSYRYIYKHLSDNVPAENLYDVLQSGSYRKLLSKLIDFADRNKILQNASILYSAIRQYR